MNKTLSVLAAIFVCLPLHALYVEPELKEIPLDRLLANLEKRAKTEPANGDIDQYRAHAEILHHLARTHAMAYASKAGTADPVKTWSGWQGKDPEQPFFGPEPAHVPYNKVTEARDATTTKIANAHLKAAIDTYRKALAAKPNDATIKLGFAWCRDQAGEKADATALYREVAAAAWEKESKSGGGLGNFLYVETTGYLIPLLDAAKNADEIAVIKRRKEKLLSIPRPVTPLVVPVGQRTELDALVNLDARVRFDLDGTGRQLEWPWITNAAAWLVFDPQHSGKITSAIQMFGSRSFLLFCADGYQALALLDDNADGAISGTELAGLALWRDANSDGISDAGEVRPVASHGITSLSTRGQPHASGLPYCPAGVIFKDGTTRPTYDLILESRAPLKD